MNAENAGSGTDIGHKVTVNGEPRRLSAGSLECALIELGYRADGVGIALARNGRIVHRAQWSSVALADSDVLDIVGAVQGG